MSDTFDRPGDGLWATGPRAVREALEEGRAAKIYIAPGGGETLRIAREAHRAGVPVETLPREGLARLAGRHHQGVAARLRAVPVLSLDEFLDRAFLLPNPVIVVLDHLEDPMNVGAIARSAEAFGAFGLILPKRRSAGIGAGAMRASSGALAHLPVAEVANIVQTLEAVKRRGGWVVATDPEGTVSASEVDFTGPVALVVGNEEKGVGRLVREKADILARLDLVGRTASLNASVATGIFLYEITRQRSPMK